MYDSASYSGGDEKAVIEACVKGEPASWQEFVRRYGRLIGATAASVRRRYGANLCDPEDMSAHVYSKLVEDQYRRLRIWRGEAKFSTYLVQVTLNLCRDYVQKHNRQAGVAFSPIQHDGPDGRAAPDARGIERERARALRQAIANLPPKQAMIMRLRLRGVALREIATIMDIPKGTVFALNSRAMAKLRDALADLGSASETSRRNTQ